MLVKNLRVRIALHSDKCLSSALEVIPLCTVCLVACSSPSFSTMTLHW